MSPTRRDKAARACALAVTAMLAAGCDAPMRIFSSATEPAERASRLTWFMVILATIVYVIVIAAMMVATRRNRGRDPIDVDLSDPGVRPIIIGGVVVPALILAAVFAVAETALGKYPDRDAAVTIKIIAHQWWWELEYELPDLQDHFRTANEIHIPVGRPVRFLLTSADVIHSFWVPQLQGKIDVIPGDTNDLRLTARVPGTYLGQCAEFCGAQHANMAITVVAEDSATFTDWVKTQLGDGQAPTDSLTAQGQALFAGGTCSVCHTVRGTPALAQIAPDLTHVGSRLTIAAGTLPNTLGNLEAWIANAQSIKPGAKMPTLTIYDGSQLRAVATYLSSLK